MNQTKTLTRERAEKIGRQILRQYGFTVESVAWISRHADEFAAIVFTNGSAQIDQARELLAREGCPLRVTSEHVGRFDTRMYVEFVVAS